MKKIKTYNQLFETGEWNKDVDLDYVEENPDCDSEECYMIKFMHEQILRIKQNLDDESVFNIIDIRGFDLYQGSYASVNIFSKKYTIWTSPDIDPEMLWIDNFPVDNTSQNNLKPGFQGFSEDIIDLLNQVINSGGDINIYKDVNKYNL